MSGLGESTRFSEYAASCLRDEFLTLIDLGSSGGIGSMWRVFGDRLQAFAFDPNIHECERLASLEQNKNVHYVPAFVTTPGNSPIMAERTRLPWSRIPANRLSYTRTQAIRTEEIEAASTAEKTRLNVWQKTTLANPRDAVVLPDFINRHGIRKVDFVKSDVDGTDYEIIRSLGPVLKELGVLGMMVEVPFFGSDSPEDHTLHNVDRFMKAQGFEIFDLTLRRYSTKYLPARYLINIPAETESGRIYQGDALFIRDLCQEDWKADTEAATPEALVKLAAIFSMFNLPDCAAEVLVKFRLRLQSIMNLDFGLDLLAAQIQGSRSKILSYHEYISEFEGDSAYFYGNEKIVSRKASITSHAVVRPYKPQNLVLHNGATCHGEETLTVIVPPPKWAYAAEFPVDPNAVPKEAGFRLRVLFSDLEGVVSVGLLSAAGNDFFLEKEITATPTCVELDVPRSGDVGSMIIRNRSAEGARVVIKIECAMQMGSPA